ncbi:hypothetical protein [Paenibacillus elgii]|uniref:hypothetical protein n=1 Tax=Paenibacillus elgii TaxID=189691 RepID=UPI0020421EA4|nr:hypothetical protein [Paenibacillus elgii]MCM3272579.1 hypothetical protein [Paenibacillus elgii]
MKHVVMYSGGSGSRNASRRVKIEHGAENTLLMFTDTLVEDRDTYRYMIESAAHLFDLPKPYHLIAFCEKIPDIRSDADIVVRKSVLPELARKTMKFMPQFYWMQDGRTPWEVFREKRWIGNSQVAQCSHQLKQELSKKWVESTFQPEEVTLYVGIDWTEIHRMESIVKHWKPYTVLAPMTEPPYQDKREMHRIDRDDGLRQQRLYEKGFSHANCGGFCVRGGQGHFINLLKQNRAYYLYNEAKELEMQEFLGRTDISILTRTVNREEQTLTLKQLREEWDAGLRQQIDIDDIGGCGCYVNYETA